MHAVTDAATTNITLPPVWCKTIRDQSRPPVEPAPLPQSSPWVADT